MIEGLITPLVTPFFRDNDQSINYAAAEKLIDHLISRGVEGLFLLGSNGEFHVLNYQEKITFAKYVIEYVDGLIPVYVGTGSCSLKEAVKLSIEMEKIGADGVSVLAPYFFQPQEEELYYYFSSIAKSVDIPVILYNIPKTVGYNLTKSLVRKLSAIGNVQAIKDSSGDMELLKSYIDVTKNYDTNVLVGSDSKISQAYQLGAKGAVAGTSNLLTDIVVELHHALQSNQKEEAAELQEKIEHLDRVLNFGTVPSILKRSIELAGIAEVGSARLPVNEPNKEVEKEIFQMLHQVNLRN